MCPQGWTIFVNQAIILTNLVEPRTKIRSKIYLSPLLAAIALRFKAVNKLLLVQCICGVLSCLCGTVICVLSSFAIIALTKRGLIVFFFVFFLLYVPSQKL